MDFDFAIVEKPALTAPVALRTIYVLYADPSYDVIKSGVPNEDCVALRTVGGKGAVVIEGFEEVTVLPGTLIFFKHDKVRRYYCSSENWDFWWFEFSSPYGLNLPLNRVLQTGTPEEELKDCTACLELLKRNDTVSLSLASAALNLLLYKWTLYIDKRPDINPHRDMVEKVIAYMRANLARGVSVRELADIAGLCERRFRQVFEIVTDVQPKKFLDKLRIDLAEELLKNTPFSVSEISDRLGYSNQFHFSKAFHKSTGMRPSLYRKIGANR